MTLLEFKKFINQIPSEMNDFDMVNGEFGLDKDGNTFIMTNNRVTTVYVDKPNKEIQILHQTDKDVKDIILGLDGNT